MSRFGYEERKNPRKTHVRQMTQVFILDRFDVDTSGSAAEVTIS